MRKLITITKDNFNICAQKLRYDFYFSIDYDKKYFWHRIFKVSFGAGICTTRHLQYEPDWIEKHTVGLFFDVGVLNVRLGIYLHPIVYRTIK